MSRPKLLAAGLLLAVLAVGAVMALRPQAEPNAALSGPDSAAAEEQIPGQPGLIIGKADAPVTLVEYGDYQCSSCVTFHKQAYPQLKSRYLDTGKVKIEYRPFPVIGPDSPRAATAAVCAAEQDKFPALHDAMYDYVDREFFARGRNGYGAGVYTDAALRNLAAGAGLDTAAFESCLGSGRHEALTAQFIRRGQAAGVAGTPTFVLSGQKIVGPQPIGVFSALIEAELAR